MDTDTAAARIARARATHQRVRRFGLKPRHAEQPLRHFADIGEAAGTHMALAGANEPHWLADYSVPEKLQYMQLRTA